jgi:hypothetical protein
MDQALSHVSGAGPPALLDTTIGQALEAASQTWGDQPALVSALRSIHCGLIRQDPRRDLHRLPWVLV